MNSGESAESVVKMTLQGVELVAKITGPTAKEVAIILYSILNDNKKLKGKTNLTNMLKSGKELKVFSLKQEQLKKFSEEAKRYGILYSVLIDKKNKNNNSIDVMVRAEDASKINRLIDKFNLSTIGMNELKPEIQKEKDNDIINPSLAKTEKSPLSEPLLKNKKNLEGSNNIKPSIRKQIRQIKENILLDKNKTSKRKKDIQLRR